jgi:hypothetical protein
LTSTIFCHMVSYADSISSRSNCRKSFVDKINA